MDTGPFTSNTSRRPLLGSFPERIAVMATFGSRQLRLERRLCDVEHDAPRIV